MQKCTLDELIIKHIYILFWLVLLFFVEILRILCLNTEINKIYLNNKFLYKIIPYN